MEDQKIRNISKLAKQSKQLLNSVDAKKLCHDTIFIFFLIMNCCCDKPMWKSQLKCGLNLILRH